MIRGSCRKSCSLFCNYGKPWGSWALPSCLFCTDLYIYCSALVSITGVHHCWQFPYSTLKKSHCICYSFHLIILQAISHIHSAYFMTSMLTWICRRSEVAMSKVVNIKQKGINMTNSGQNVPGIKAAISSISDLPHLIVRILILLTSIALFSLINFKSELINLINC